MAINYILIFHVFLEHISINVHEIEYLYILSKKNSS